jgi:hypothetical protein
MAVADQKTRIDTADVLAIDAAVGRTTGSDGYGVTRDGFVPKPFARLLAEKLAVARGLFGHDLDLGSGSAIRKLLEVTALEDARTWAGLASMYDDGFIASARGDALSRLGEEVGFPRPYLEGHGTVKLTLQGGLPAGTTTLTIPRGARMLSAGGHHAATDETVVLSASSPEREVAASAFYPGPDGNLVHTSATQKIDRWNPADATLKELFDAQAAAQTAGSPFSVQILQTTTFTGGELQWPDPRYRDLLLRAPRSVWTADAIEIAVSLVPGVRQVQVRDAWGGLDIHQSIFGNFNFIQRVFGSERDLGSPYYLTILVAPTPAAIWAGPDGLRASIESAVEDLRPISIFPSVEEADEVGIGVHAELAVRNLPLPTGSPTVVNASPAAVALKDRLLRRVGRYVDDLGFGDPVRYSEVMWALMNEPGIADVRDLRIVRYPPGFDTVDFGSSQTNPAPEELDCGGNVDLQVNQIPRFVDSADGLGIL